MRFAHPGPLPCLAVFRSYAPSYYLQNGNARLHSLHEAAIWCGAPKARGTMPILTQHGLERHL